MIGRDVPIQLAQDLSDAATSTCRLLRITQIGMPSFGLTSLDRDISFDVGYGELLYKAKRGFNASASQATADLAVDNAEAEVLIAEFEFDGVTAAAIAEGRYDGAKFEQYLINYREPSHGATIIDSGTIGRITNVDGLTATMEFRSLTQTLKQKSIIESGSNSCRVQVFGDERCKLDVEAMFVEVTVTALGIEADRVFTIAGTGLDLTLGAYAPGWIEGLTGDNTGRGYAIESYDAGVVTLRRPLDYPNAVTDEWKIRPDCSRLWSGHLSCQHHNNRPHFRGEPKRPVSESASLMAPGAASTGGSGTTNTQTEIE